MDDKVSGKTSVNLTSQHEPEAVPLSHASRRTEEHLARLGHEMRNPLSALSSALEIWGDARTDPVELEKLRHVMIRQVSQLIRFSEDLIDEERISQGKLTLRKEPVDLWQLIDNACEEVRPFIDRRGHSLIIRMSPTTIVVHGDSSRLIQVFANLIQNAAKFTERHGSLHVTAKVLDGMAAVRVCDNGPGIEEQMLSKIFEASTPLMGMCGPEENGLGIGLRLVKLIVELHGGSVVAQSAGLGHGSEFTVLLPLSKDDYCARSPTAQPDATVNCDGQTLPAYRILVVDDDRSNRVLLAKMLEKIGQTVTVASNGEMAVRTVLDERPQVVFLDLVMQSMDGCNVASQLRRHPDLKNLVLIALSGNGDERTKQRAMAAGFDAYLVKPTSITELIDTLSVYSLQT